MERVIGSHAYGQDVITEEFKGEVRRSLLEYKFARADFLSPILKTKISKIEAAIEDLIVESAKSKGRVDYVELWKDLCVSYIYILKAADSGRIEFVPEQIKALEGLAISAEEIERINNNNKKRLNIANQLKNAFNESNRLDSSENVCKGYHFQRR